MDRLSLLLSFELDNLNITRLVLAEQSRAEGKEPKEQTVET